MTMYCPNCGLEKQYADIIAIRGDVLRYINLLQNVDIVIKHGKRWK